MGKKLIKPGEKVGLKLTQTQQSLILDAQLPLSKEVEEALRSTQPGEPLMLTLDDLEDLAGCVAAETNHTKDKTLKKKLE